jgi:hypothetical protein
VGEFGRTPLLMLAASIESAGHWVMVASHGAITLTPLRMMSGEERRSTRDRAVLLHLTDLGYLTSTEGHAAMPATSPLSNSVGVLLFPWLLQATVARLDTLARTTAAEIPGHFAPEDWLETWHHFVDDAEWNPGIPKREIARLASLLPGLPVARVRHVLFGSLANEAETLEFGAREADPLVFTHP